MEICREKEVEIFAVWKNQTDAALLDADEISLVFDNLAEEAGYPAKVPEDEVAKAWKRWLAKRDGWRCGNGSERRVRCGATGAGSGLAGPASGPVAIPVCGGWVDGIYKNQKKQMTKNKQ